MYQHKWDLWRKECVQIINEHHNRQIKALASVFVCELLQEQEHNEREYWVRPLLQKRKLLGFFYSIYPEISLLEGDFKEYFRMSRVQMEELLVMVAPKILKVNAIREAIPPAERLCLTIRFLASGDSMTSMSYLFLIGLATVAQIIEETCAAIWETLVGQVLPHNLSPYDWLKIAGEFEQQWNFPHCIGAIDGKHIVIQCPDNAGSNYFNYKHSHSIVLLGMCDANYKFIFVDVGAYGRRSDGGVFRESMFGHRFLTEDMNLPSPQPISIGRPPVPYVLVGDEAFPLSHFLMRPYPGKGGLNDEKKIYNYRLSRCRRTIENTFGILANRWRVLRRPIICNVNKSEKIVQATIVLHNWLRQQDLDVNQYVSSGLIDSHDETNLGSWCQDYDGNDMRSLYESQNDTDLVIKIRDEFCRYFNGDGVVHWQFQHC